MKKYIIITPNISNIGGAQIYIRNKMIFLEENGWSVQVFFYRKGEILLAELKRFYRNHLPLLELSPLVCSKKDCEKIINKIPQDSIDELIVESHNKNLALWGEIIANRLFGKHIIYLLSESFKKLSYSEYLFFDFKHKRGELAGISRESLAILFSEYKSVNEKEKFFLRASCTNVVENVENEKIDKIDKADINIGCITRLEKKFVPKLLDEIIIFSDRNNEKTIQLIFFGGTNNKQLEKDIDYYVTMLGKKNFKLTITGYLYPIPKKIFQLADVFVSVAGSALVSAREGVPTISLDVNDCKPIGILGYDTSHTLYRDRDYNMPLHKLLEDILINKAINLECINIMARNNSGFREEYLNHMRFIANSNKEMQYYDFTLYRSNLKERIRTIAFKILGQSSYKRILYKVQKHAKSKY